jgi:hypothetical protein
MPLAAVPNPDPDPELVKDIERLLGDVKAGHVRSVAAYYMGDQGIRGNFIWIDKGQDAATLLGGAIAVLLTKLCAMARADLGMEEE